MATPNRTHARVLLLALLICFRFGGISAARQALGSLRSNTPTTGATSRAVSQQEEGLDIFAADNANKPYPDDVCVTITGAAGQMAYALVPLIMEGCVFGKDRRVRLRLLDVDACADALEGVAMEIRDCYCRLVSDVVATTDPRVAFEGAHVAVLLGGFPRRPGTERRELIAKNVPIMAEHGKALAECASKHVRVLVVANPACTNCLVASACAPAIPKSQFSSLSRLDHDRLSAMLAEEISIEICEGIHREGLVQSLHDGDEDSAPERGLQPQLETQGLLRIRNVCVWGNHSPTMWPDISRAEAKIMHKWIPVEYLLGRIGCEGDLWSKWLKRGWSGGHDAEAVQAAGKLRFAKRFVPALRARGTKVIEARGKSSALSAANSIANHLRDWLSLSPLSSLPRGEDRLNDSGEEEAREMFTPCASRVLSMGVSSDGNPYHVPEGLFFSFPVDCSEGRHRILDGFCPDQDLLNASAKELLAERSEAFDVLQKPHLSKE